MAFFNDPQLRPNCPGSNYLKVLLLHRIGWPWTREPTRCGKIRIPKIRIFGHESEVLMDPSPVIYFGPGVEKWDVFANNASLWFLWISRCKVVRFPARFAIFTPNQISKSDFLSMVRSDPGFTVGGTHGTISDSVSTKVSDSVALCLIGVSLTASVHYKFNYFGLI